MADFGYLGNPLLKKSNTPIEWDAELMKEYYKCANDPIYFAEKYIKIVHVDRGLIPIELYDYQKEIIDAVGDNRRTVVATSRQAGKCVSINAIVTVKIENNILNITMGELHEIFLEEQNTNIHAVQSRWDRICRMFDLWVPGFEIPSKNTQFNSKRIFWPFNGRSNKENTAAWTWSAILAHTQEDFDNGKNVRKPELQDLSFQHEIIRHKNASGNPSETRLEHATRNQKDNVEKKDLYSRTNRKFVKVFDVENIFISTPSGWENISKFNITIPYDKVKVKFSNGRVLDCADNHILIDANGDQIYAKDSFGKFIRCETGNVLVVEMIDCKIKETMYDLTVDSKDHVYYTNGILSHNTTTAAVIILHYILFNEYKTVGLLANKAASALEILNRIQLAYEALPKWLQQGVVTWNKGSMELENGCKVIAAASSSSSVRGASISFLYIDESAFLLNWQEFFSSVYPTISSGQETKILLTSTPNSLNHFWKICKEAQEELDPLTGRGKNGYKYIEVKWDRVPGRDEAWRKDMLASLGGNVEQFNQEFAVSFIGSVNTLISGPTLKALSYSQPIKKAENISQYAIPIPAHTYVMVVDVSRGKGLDYSTFSIVDVTSMPYKQVCTFRDNYISPADYASILFRIAKLYNNAYVLIEINDIGGQVADTLYMEFGYENMLCTESGGRSGKRISSGFGQNIDRGIRTSKSVKSIGCSLLKLLIEQNQLIVEDFDTIDELAHFSRKGVSYEADSGSHDDMVMTLVLFAWLCDQNYFKDLVDINTVMKLRERTEQQIDDDLIPFGYIIGGEDIETIIAERELGSSIRYE